MLKNLRVVHLHRHPGKAEYIGRKGKGAPGSPLANPRRLGDPRPDGGVWERGGTLRAYEEELRAALDPSVDVAFWGYLRDGKTPRRLTSQERAALREEMNRLFQIAEKEELCLACFCAPQDCHGDILVKLLREADLRRETRRAAHAATSA